jgi:drug/metabolite transporter (DMT)-like permease
MYLSLEHLSVSDATMLTFITPILLVFSGAIFLKEPFSLRAMLSGCRRRWSIYCDRFSQTASV